MNSFLTVVILLVVFSAVSCAGSEKELALDKGASDYCSPFNLSTNPSPKSIESKYCGYQYGLKTARSYLPEVGFSTRNNAKGHALWKKSQFKQACLKGEKKSILALQKHFPSYKVDCNKYKNYHLLMTDDINKNAP